MLLNLYESGYVVLPFVAVEMAFDIANSFPIGMYMILFPIQDVHSLDGAIRLQQKDNIYCT